MTLTDCFDRLAEPTRTSTVYAPPPRPEIVDRIAAEIGADAVDYRPLPSATAADQAFLVVREGEAFVAAVGLDAVREFLDPPIVEPWAATDADPSYRRVIDVFETTVWRGLDRRQLLAISREIEGRAWRVGSGTVRVGFQRAAAFEAMTPVYVRLAGESSLDVHVYIDDEWNRPSVPGVTIHADAGNEIGDYWFLTFDGGGDELWTSGLLARERDDGSFEGYWTDDARLVATLERAILESATDAE